MKPGHLVAFLKSFLGFYALILFFEAVLPAISHEDVDWGKSLAIAGYGSAFLGFSIVLMFTPKFVDWDSRNFRIETRVLGLGEFRWEKLEAYSAFGGGLVTFLIKFEGRRTFQIVPVGFHPNQWREFKDFLNENYPEKKTWLWIGPFPVRLWKS